jgi:inhibitor of KinA sporulation pathway (predicted exonuclease)
MMHFVLFDLEMTCWESEYPVRNREIIELGAVLLSPYGKEMSRFERLVKPVENPRLSFYCANLTGIQQEDVDNGLTFLQCYRDFSQWLHQYDVDKLFVAWGASDQTVLEEACRINRLNSLLEGDYLDAKRAYHDLKNINYRLGLVKAMRHEGLEFEGEPHRALTDSLNLARLFRKYIGEWPL